MIMRKVARLILFVFFIAGFAGAQNPPHGNIFVGYSYMNADADLFRPAPLGGVSANGWEGSVEGKLLPWVGVVADFGGNYGSGQPICPPPPFNPLIVCSRVSARLHTVLFGPRVSVSIGRFTPFVHGLFGVGHISDSTAGFSDSDTSFVKDIGAGFDYKLMKGLAWRVQADGIFTNFFGIPQDSARAATGIVFRF
jgi:hypothetical protein